MDRQQETATSPARGGEIRQLQHFVHQSYLRGFSDEEKHVTRYRKSPPAKSRKTIRSIFAEPEMMTVDWGDGDVINELEDWARRIASVHLPSINVAARRTVSAIAHRTEKADALIDAVTAWENLVGTESEVTFRVTAALAKLAHL